MVIIINHEIRIRIPSLNNQGDSWKDSGWVFFVAKIWIPLFTQSTKQACLTMEVGTDFAALGFRQNSAFLIAGGVVVAWWLSAPTPNGSTQGRGETEKVSTQMLHVGNIYLHFPLNVPFFT